MNKYLVTWEIDAEEATPEDAAKHAWHMRNGVGSTAKVFIVEDVGTGKRYEIDLYLKTTKEIK